MSLPLFNNRAVLSAIIPLLLVISACSSRNRPAPVIDVNTSITPINQRIKGSITSKQHVVKKGETLYSISWRSNVDIRTIASINQLSPPYQIYPGQKIFLSQKPHKASGDQSSVKNRVNTAQKTSKKSVAHKKKQAYGENVSEQKESDKVNLDHKKTANKVELDQNDSILFPQNIRVWKWPVKGKLIAKFSSALQGNKGIDIAGKTGVKIRAAADGKVVYAGDVLRGYGKLVILKHNNDYLSAYAHNDEILVKEQQLVKAGDVITTMGNTGAEQVMLHFEVRYKGKSVNPLKYLPKE